MAKEKKMNVLDYVAIVLLIVGGFNWGLIGFFNYNLVANIFGAGMFVKIVYDLVGVSAVYSIYSLWKIRK